MKKLLFILISSLLFVSCIDHEDVNYNQYTDIATVENPDQNTVFFMKLDNNIRLKTVASDISYYRPKDGQRVIASYSVLSVLNDTSLYKYNVKLNDVYEILTKGIFKITPETADSIGNDEIQISDMWIGNEYLNVEFTYPGYNKVHFINLVSDSTKTYTDDKVHLEFRHNANGDYPSYSKWGLVSFDMRSLKENATADSVNLVIHTKEFSTGTTDRSYNLTYKFGNGVQTYRIQKMQIPSNAEKAR